MQAISIQNRNEAYKSIIDELPLRSSTVLRLIKDYGGLTNQELADKMIVDKNQVTGRVTELSNQYLIIGDSKKMNEKTRRLNTVWRLTTKEERHRMALNEYNTLEKEFNALSLDEGATLSTYALKILKDRNDHVQKRLAELIEII